MIYMENIFICISAPLLIGMLLLRGETRRFILFYWLGVLICMFSAYINSYVAATLENNGEASLTVAQSMVRVAPIFEEALKALPVFVFAALTVPKRRELVAVALAVGLGFATFENICYIMVHGAEDLTFVLIRGFAAGVTHAVCAAILGFGFALFYGRSKLVWAGAFSLLCVSSTYHSIYNLLVASEGWQAAGYTMPLITAAVILFFATRQGELFREES